MSSASFTKSRTKGVVLPGDHAVQPGQGLYRLHPVEPLVDIHGVQQRLVEAGLVFVGHQQHLVVRRVKPFGQLCLADGLAGDDVLVHAGLGVFEARVRIVHGAAEGDQRPDVGVALLRDVGSKASM